MKLKRIASHASPVIAIGALVFVVAISASMLSNLRHALGGRGRREEPTERDRIRRALAPMLMELDPEIWGELLAPLPVDFDEEAFRRSLPVLDPPLSQTIIEDRDSSSL
jgi:hypothetical protein